MTRLEVLLAYPRARYDLDSIAGYTRRLAGALQELPSTSAGWVEPQAAFAAARRQPPYGGQRVVLLQYNPFSYGPRGLAPGLAARCLAMHRASADRTRLALMVHEPYVPIRDWRSLAMGAAQRAQLFAIARSAELVLGASEAWARLVTRAARLSRRARVAAVGSNVPDARGAREAERRRLEIGSGTVVLSHLSTPHPSRLAEHVVRAANGVAATGLRVVLLNLGAHAPGLRGLDSRVAIRTPGRIADPALARAIAASDVFLSPCIDGVSVRRTSLMAALQQGCCVVGTESPTTDAVLRGGGLELTPVRDVEGFAQRVVRLAHDRELRARSAEGARRLYEQRFSWPVLAADLARDLRTVASGS